MVFDINAGPSTNLKPGIEVDFYVVAFHINLVSRIRLLVLKDFYQSEILKLCKFLRELKIPVSEVLVKSLGA